ncbi:putative Rz1 protein [Morganella phage Mecenats66]|nr:putative Rz1 protein [Morganella phage Mecenats66]
MPLWLKNKLIIGFLIGAALAALVTYGLTSRHYINENRKRAEGEVARLQQKNRLIAITSANNSLLSELFVRNKATTEAERLEFNKRLKAEREKKEYKSGSIPDSGILLIDEHVDSYNKKISDYQSGEWLKGGKK